MPRPPKERNICRMPKACRFGPLPEPERSHPVIRMTVDEYEAIRLIDLEGCTQEECAQRMQIARSTVQMIYNEARRKMADCLVNGRPLIIDGGSYRLCDGTGCCPAGKCPRHKRDALLPSWNRLQEDPLPEQYQSGKESEKNE